MIAALLHLILILVVIGVIWWAAKEIVGVMPIEGAIKNVILVVIKVVALVLVCVLVVQFVIVLLGGGLHITI